ncbi:MAG: hypothetical protein HYZ11_01305 [Candidatus Tectomicrobia bacterium]|uniref:DNA-directed DNA polymerase n=1 Tax=Tectimicrobiota bacterium TaxID=2528274 RepID=A0A932HVF5_UNCTE|nr:hypothetical protein [Candidatus Tectomicrobia bacterium]
MGWENLRGQDAAVAALRRDLTSGRVAHAYVFHGPPGAGKGTAARLFAQALQCEAPEAERPCGACLPCRKVAGGVHPDVVTVRPEMDRSGKPKRSIGIDAVREQVLARAYLRPQEGRRQAFILDNSDEPVTVDAFSALLKTLEEPSPDTLLLLLTPNLQGLPATIVSRCRKVRFRALARADQRAVLASLQEAGRWEGEGMEPDEVISLTMGRLGLALEGGAEALARRREAALEFIEGLSAPPGKADEVQLLLLAGGQVAGGEASREAAVRFLEMLRGLLRDILILQAAPGAVEPWHADLEETLAGIGRRWGMNGLTEALDRVEAALHDVGVVNTNPALTLEALVFALRATVALNA